MAQVVIEIPILKSSFEEPTRRFKFTGYSNVSRPFPLPGIGKIAVKVINHCGDEVLKVYEVS